MPYSRSFALSPNRYGPLATDPLSELPEPTQTSVRQLLRQPIPEGMNPVAYAANFDGMGWMASSLNYRAAGAELHRVAEYIRGSSHA